MNVAQVPQSAPVFQILATHAKNNTEMVIKLRIQDRL